MFQKIATIFIQRFLNRFIYKLEQEKLNISVWNGTASLKDIKLKSYSFLTHGIPLKIDEGSKIGDFYLKLNWAKLSTEKIIVKIDNIDIFLSPTDKTGFSENIESYENIKRTQLDAWEEFYFSNENEADGDSSESYMKKYIVTIINNLEISITNINVRLTSPVLKQLNNKFYFKIPEIVITKEAQGGNNVYEENKKLNITGIEFSMIEFMANGKEIEIPIIDPISTSLSFRWTRDLKKLKDGNSAYRLDGIINSLFINLNKKTTHSLLYFVRELLLLVKHFSEINPTKFVTQTKKEQLKEFLLKQFLLYKDNTIQLEKNYGHSSNQISRGFYNHKSLTEFFKDKRRYIELYTKRFNVSGFYEQTNLEELKKLETKYNISVVIFFRKCAFLKAYISVPRSFFSKIRIPEKRPKYFLKKETNARKITIEDKISLFKQMQNDKFSVIKKSLVKFENIQGKSILLFSGDLSIQSVSVNLMKSETKPLLMALLSELTVNVSARGDDLFFNTNLEKFSIYSSVISSTETIEILRPLDNGTLLNISLGLIKNENKLFVRVISNAVEMVYSHILLKEIKAFLPPKGFFRELEANSESTIKLTDQNKLTSAINYGIKDLNKLFANKRKLELDIKMQAPVLNIVDIENPIKFKMGCLKVYTTSTFEEDEDYLLVKEIVEKNHENYIKPLRYQRNNIKVEFTQTNLSIKDQNINSKLDLNLFIGLNSRKDKRVFIDVTGLLKGIEIDFRTDFIMEVLKIISIHKRILETPDKITGEKLFLQSDGISTKKQPSSISFFRKYDKSILNVNFLFQSIFFRVFNAQNKPWAAVNVSNILVNNYQKKSYDQTMLIMEDVLLKVLDPQYENIDLRLHKIRTEFPPFIEKLQNNEPVYGRKYKKDLLIILHSYIESLELTYRGSTSNRLLGVVKALEIFIDEPFKNFFLEILNSKLTLPISDFNRTLLLYIFVMKQIDGITQLIDSIISETYINDNQLAEKVMETFKDLSNKEATKHPLFLSLQKQIFFDLKSFEVNLNAIEGDPCIVWKFDQILINFLVVPFIYTEILLKHYQFSIANQSTLPRYKDYKKCFKTFLSLDPKHSTETALEIRILSYFFNPSTEIEANLNKLFWVHTFFTWEIIEFVLAIQETEGINKLIEMDAVIKSLGFEDTKPLNIKMNIDDLICFIPIDPKNSISECLTTNASLKLNFLIQSNDDVVVSFKSNQLNTNTTYLTEKPDNSFKVTPMNESTSLLDMNSFTGILVYNLTNLNTSISIDIPKAFSTVSREDILLIMSIINSYSSQDELHNNYSIFRKAFFEIVNCELPTEPSTLTTNEIIKERLNTRIIKELICLKESVSLQVRIAELCLLINDDFSAKKSPLARIIMENFDGTFLQKESVPVTVDFKTVCSVVIDFFNSYRQTWRREFSSFKISTDSRMSPFGRFINRLSIHDKLYLRISEQVLFQILEVYYNLLGIIENNKDNKVSDYLHTKMVLLENKLSYQNATKKLKVINLTGQKVYLSKFKKTIRTKYGSEIIFLKSPTDDRNSFRQKKHSEIYLSEAKLQTPSIDLFEKSIYKFKIPFKFNKEKHFQTFFIRTYVENGTQNIKFHSNFAIVNATNFEFYTKERDIRLIPNSKEYLPFDVIFENKIKFFCKELYNTKSQKDIPVELLLNSRTINILSVGNSYIQTRPYYSESLDLYFILIYCNLELYNHIYSTVHVKLTESTGNFKQQNFELKHKDKENIYGYKTSKNLKLDLATGGYQTKKGLQIGTYLNKKPIEYKCTLYNSVGCCLVLNMLSVKSNKSIFLRKLFKKLFDYEVDEFSEFKAMLEVIEIHLFSRISVLNITEKIMSINPTFVFVEDNKKKKDKQSEDTFGKESFSRSRSSNRTKTYESLILQNKEFKPIGYTSEHNLYFKFDLINCKWCSFKLSKIKTDRDYEENVHFTSTHTAETYETAKIVMSVTNEPIVVSESVMGENGKPDKFYRPLLNDSESNLALKRHIKTTIITVSPMFKFINNLDIKITLRSHKEENDLHIEIPPKSAEPVFMDIAVFKNKKLEKLNFQIEFPSKTRVTIEIDPANHNNFTVEGYDELFNIITYPTGSQTVLCLNRVVKDNIQGVLENLTPFNMFVHANGRLDSLIEPYSTKAVKSHSHNTDMEYFLCTKNGVYMTRISFGSTNLNSFVSLNESNHFNKVKSYSVIGLSDQKEMGNQAVYEKEKSIIVYKYRSKGRTIFVILNKQIEFKKIISDFSFKYRNVFKHQTEYLRKYSEYSRLIKQNKEKVSLELSRLQSETPQLFVATIDGSKSEANVLEMAKIHIAHRDSGSIVFDFLSETISNPTIISLSRKEKKQRIVFLVKKSFIKEDCLVVALETPVFKSRGVVVPINILDNIDKDPLVLLFKFENNIRLKIKFEKVDNQETFDIINEEYYNLMIRSSLKKRNKLLEEIYSDKAVSFRPGFNQSYEFVDYYYSLSGRNNTEAVVDDDISAHALILVLQLKDDPKISSFVYLKRFNEQKEENVERNLLFLPSSFINKLANISIFQEYYKEEDLIDNVFSLKRKLLKTEDFIVKKPQFHFSFILSLYYVKSQVNLHLDLMVSFGRPLDISKKVDGSFEEITKEEEDAIRVIKKLPETIIQLKLNKLVVYYDIKRNGKFISLIGRRISAELLSSETCYYSKLAIKSLRMYVIKLKNNKIKKFLIYKKIKKETEAFRISMGGYYDNYKDEEMRKLYHPALNNTFEVFAIDVAPFIIYLENNLLNATLRFLKTYKEHLVDRKRKDSEFINSKDYPKQIKEIIKYNEEIIESFRIGESDTCYYFNLLKISPISFKAAFMIDSDKVIRNLADIRIAEAHQIRFMLNIMEQIAIDELPLSFDLIYTEDLLANYSELSNKLSLYYKSQFLFLAPKIIGSLTILGNPINLISNLKQGVSDAFVTPTKNAKFGASQFIDSLSIGTASLVGHAMAGVGGSLSGFSSSFSNLLSSVSLDPNYLKKRKKLRKKHLQSTPSIGRALKDAAINTANGVTGLITKPVESISNEGAKGILPGLGKGLGGFLSKPFVSIFDVTSEVFKKITHGGKVLISDTRRAENKRKGVEDSDSSEDFINELV